MEISHRLVFSEESTHLKNYILLLKFMTKHDFYLHVQKAMLLKVYLS